MGMQLSDWVENIGKGEIACTSNFFFSHNVIKSCLLLMRQNKYLSSSGLDKSWSLQCQINLTDIVSLENNTQIVLILTLYRTTKL